MTLTDARLWLAVLALMAYCAVAAMFSFWPPKLSGDQAAMVLNTLSNITLVAFTFFFKGKMDDAANGK